jgi:hypothetical protein
MPAAPQIAPVAATSASVIVIKPGVEIPGEEVGGVPAKVASVQAIFGWQLNESTGSAEAKFRIRDGISASGREIATVTVLAKGVSDVEFAEATALTGNGIFLEVLSGSVEGSVLWG